MARKKKGTVHGWVVLDKPYGMTSTQAVGAMKRIFGTPKAGHAGTLDPLASGMLPIALGVARAHGGSLQVSSEPGSGAEFVLRLPVQSQSREDMHS